MKHPYTHRLTTKRAREWAIVLSLVILALIPRLYQLSACPPGISRDELFNAIDALRIGEHGWPIFVEGDYGNYGREALFIYLMAVSLRLLGQTIFAIRLPAVLLGIGSVILCYFIGRTMFNRRVGVLAAALMAVSLWPIMGSRWGLRAVSLTFCTALTVYCFGRGLSNRCWTDWLVAGVALGLTLYTYIPSRVFPAVILTWLVWAFFTQREQLRSNYRNVLISLIVALIIFVPFGWYYA